MFRIEITDKEILECKDAKSAMRMSLDRSPQSLKAVAIDLGMSDSHLSRCLNPNDLINLPHDKILLFMTSCGNAIYLRYLYLRLKDLLPELEHDDGACIASAVEGLRLELREAITEIKAARPGGACKECGAHFALTPDVLIDLVAEALLIERDLGGTA